MQHKTAWDSQSQIAHDARLPDEINPSTTCTTHKTGTQTTPVTSKHALLTGATGFLGRYVIRALIQQTDLKLTCLIRADSTTQAQQRLHNTLVQTGINTPDVIHRIKIVCGDLTQSRFGLNLSDYEYLAQSVDSIYHCAALVNWARSYRKLRQVNVLGTLEVIRFACHLRRKPLLFVSSIAACFANNRTDKINEDTDMLPHIAHMPLGYAQSKCVAESLLKQSAQRGLPVTILRPALISGATDSGFSNTEDFVAALLQGCVRTGMAMDEDWLLDFVPVDFVAEVVASMTLAASAPRSKPLILHLVADPPRYWRELILWLNLYGYPINLVPPSEWLAAVFKDRINCGQRLYNYRRFFQGLPGQLQQAKPYECYLQTGQQLIESRISNRMLAENGLEIPPLDAALLQRYLSYFQRCGLLPKLPPRHSDSPDQQVILKILQQPDAELQPISLNTDNGILNQLAAAYAGAAVGLRAYRVTSKTSSVTTDIVVKTKCADKLVIDSTVKMAALCHPKLGELFLRFRDQLGLSGAQQREAALYEQAEPALQQYRPHCFGVHHDVDNRLTTIVLEKLPATAKIDQWNLQQMRAVIEGLAHIQTVDCTALNNVLKRELSTATMLEMMPLWLELAKFSARQSDAASELLPLQERYIEEIADWWPLLLEQPQVLIHGDFNLRNLILRGSGMLCAYDWELASLGLPQRDLAEFLCFTLNSEKHSTDAVYALIEEHHKRYLALTETAISTADWQRGFHLTLRQFSITRLPMYALINRFRSQRFLTKIHFNSLWLLKVTST